MRRDFRCALALGRLQAASLARERGAWWIAATAGAVVLGCGGLRVFHLAGAEERFLGSVAGTILASSGSLLAAVVAPRLLRGGDAPGWPWLLAARGVSARLWVGASFAALLVALAWLTAMAAFAFGIAAARFGHDGWEAGWNLARGQFGPLVVVAASALAWAALLRRSSLATAATLILAAAGHLAPALAWAAAQQPGGVGGLSMIIVRLVPDLAAAASGSVDAVRAGQALAFLAVAVSAGAYDEA